MSGSDTFLRKLTHGDIPAAIQLSIEAGWNQTEDDWRLLVELAPDGCFGIEIDRELVSTATLFTYGTKLAWVGMVLTRVEFRGRGFARRLLTHALSVADSQGVESVKLDATDEGRPLYEKLGFRQEQLTERWERPGGRARAEGALPESSLSQESLALDAKAFGVDRSALLQYLETTHRPVTLGKSYLMSRPGRLNQYLGPCVAESYKAARTLIEGTLQQATSGGWFWDILPANEYAVTLARDLGFIPKRQLVRMVRGKDQRGDEESIYALAGFELG